MPIALSTFWRRVEWTVLAIAGTILLVFLLAIGAARLWLLPVIDRYRPDIVAALSQATGLDVKIGHVDGDWTGLWPRLALSQVVVTDRRGGAGLTLDRIDATLSWWSLATWDVRLHSVEVAAPSLAIRRDAEGRLYVAGFEIKATPGGSGGFLHWVLRQPNIVVRDATVHWTDARRPDLEPLVISHVMLRLENRRLRHRLGIQASPPSGIARAIDARVDLRETEEREASTWPGSVYVDFDRIDVAAVRHFVDLPDALRGARGSGKVWADFGGTRIRSFTADVDLTEVDAKLGPTLPDLAFDVLRGHLAYAIESGEHVVTGHQLVFARPGERGPLAPMDFNVRVGRRVDGSLAHVAVNGRTLDLARIASVLAALPLGEGLNERLARIAPEGRVAEVSLDWASDMKRAMRYRVKAQFDALGFGALDPLPALRGLSGKVNANERGGSGEVTSSAMHFEAPAALAVPLDFQTLRARATWSVRNGAIELGIPELALENGDLSAVGKGAWRSAPGGPGSADINVSFARIDPAGVWRYIPRSVPQHTRDWLQKALLGGRAVDGSLAIEGDLAQFPFKGDRGGQFRAHTRIGGGLLSFNERWPRIENIDADLDFRGERMEITGRSARTLGGALEDVHVVIPDLGDSHSTLQIRGTSRSPAAEHLRYVAQSPVHELIHGATDRLLASGDGLLTLDIALPLDRMRDGKVKGSYRFLGGGVSDAKSSFPPLTAVKGTLGFSETGIEPSSLAATILGGPAALQLQSQPGGAFVIDAHGRIESGELFGFVHNPVLKRLSGRADWTGKVVAKDDKTDLDLHTQVTLLGGPVDARVFSRPEGGIGIDLAGRLDPASLARELGVDALRWIEGRPDWKGSVEVRDDNATARATSQVSWLGQPVDVTLETVPSGGVRVTTKGSASVEAVAAAWQLEFLKPVRGVAAWTGEFLVRDDGYDARVNSSLEGVRSDLPAPLGKSATEGLALALQETSSAAARNATLSVGRQFALRAAGASGGKAATPTWRRVEIALGGAPVPAPARDGLFLSGGLPAVDLDAWRPLLFAPAPAPEKNGAAATHSALPSLVGADLRFGSMRAGGRTFGPHDVQVQCGERACNIGLRGAELSGTAEWQTEGKGRLVARLDTLSFPAAPVDQRAAAPKEADHSVRTDLPGMDIQARNFSVRGHLLGRLEVTAQNEGHDWRLSRLQIVNPNATMTASGLWKSMDAGTRTSLTVDLDARDVGGLLGDLGYPGTVKRGTSRIQGNIAWDGGPVEFSPPTLDGTLRLDAKSGQFLKVEPGVGKLLGLISLQSLPRRVKLDFRDIFSGGFAFDSIGADLAIARGIMHTDNFAMTGPAARIALRGDADLRNETQNVSVRVVPSLGESVALTAGVLGGPVAGAATLLVEKLLRNPLDQFLSYEYSISGSWSDPQIAKAARGTTEKRGNDANNIRR